MAGVGDVTEAVMEGVMGVRVSLKDLESSVMHGICMTVCRRIQEAYNDNQSHSDVNTTSDFGTADVSLYNRRCELAFKGGVMTINMGPQEVLAMPLDALSSAVAIGGSPSRLVILGPASSHSFSLDEDVNQVALVLHFDSEEEVELALQKIRLSNVAATGPARAPRPSAPTPPAKPPRMHQRLRAQKSLPAPRHGAVKRQASLNPASFEWVEAEDPAPSRTTFLSPSSAEDAEYPLRGTLSGSLHAQNCNSGIYDPVPEPKSVAERQGSATPEPEGGEGGGGVRPVPHLLVSTKSPQHEVATSEPVLSPVIKGEAQIPPFLLVSSPATPVSPAGRPDSGASPGEGGAGDKFDFRNV
ncbi:uncharacterized protein LOC122258144 [Penaeus japonicus]|uniref:uncharacterized protein LOC122258144 n=1 Tax=Penaeus japonicus TaxID=27405 RepID=UPI001C70E9F2|nr:uncharacterized protein LOC122258144 [Penaeus japonicus]XP_042879854.1 uncharacterized protein LOC122258144 [Penaeus japonicus]